MAFTFTLSVDRTDSAPIPIFLRDFDQDPFVKFFRGDGDAKSEKDIKSLWDGFKYTSCTPFSDVRVADKKQVIAYIFTDLIEKARSRYDLGLAAVSSRLEPDVLSRKQIKDSLIKQLVDELVEGVIVINSFDTLVDEATEL